MNQFKVNCIQEGGINPHSKSVLLRKFPKMSAKIVGKLKPHEFYSLTKAPSHWVHYYSLSNHLVIRKKDFNLGYTNVCGIFIVKSSNIQRYEDAALFYSFPLSIIFGFLLILLFVKSYLSSIKSKCLELEEQEIQRNNQELEICNIEQRYNIKLKEYQNIIETLDSKNKIFEQSIERENKRFNLERKNMEKAILDLKSKNKNLYIKQNDINQSVEKEKKKIEAEFYEQARKEIDITYRENMNEMKKSTLILEKKYIEAKKKAKILGVDLDDSNIDGLVKGRFFELFAATIWDEDNRVHIEDWTPDKGINEKIYVKSNGNPDFLVSFQDLQKLVAIECKFRSKFKEGTFTNLGSDKSITRYKKYQIEKNVRVYILFGINGNPQHPDDLYLIPLDKIESIRIKDKYYQNMNTTKKLLRTFKINKSTLINKMTP